MTNTMLLNIMVKIYLPEPNYNLEKFIVQIFDW